LASQLFWPRTVTAGAEAVMASLDAARSSDPVYRGSACGMPTHPEATTSPAARSRPQQPAGWLELVNSVVTMRFPITADRS